ncbi:hypothetical protein NUW58_g9376 [Xylaria curta]|uniref:Uncharacterized protein n=1 Tax=Xylaria curta TaxID=42375 RepID=A0ACC1MX51_9PEZI|nr:hypothetical protein NUW58_g9376 [Xylaria curta]
MTTVLGKRKSRTQKADPSISPEEAQARLARFFEADFKPLFPTAKPTPTSEIEEEEEEPIYDSDSSDNDSWDGFSEDEAEDGTLTPPTIVEVVSHTEAYTATTNTLDKRESRAWLSSRPPLSISAEDTSSSKK